MGERGSWWFSKIEIFFHWKCCRVEKGRFADGVDLRNLCHSVDKDDTNVFFFTINELSHSIVGHLKLFFQEIINAHKIPKGGGMGGQGHSH